MVQVLEVLAVEVVLVEVVLVVEVQVEVHSIDVWNPRVLAGTSGTARSSSLQSRAKETDFSPAAVAAAAEQQQCRRTDAAAGHQSACPKHSGRT